MWCKLNSVKALMLLSIQTAEAIPLRLPLIIIHSKGIMLYLKKEKKHNGRGRILHYDKGRKC